MRHVGSYPTFVLPKYNSVNLKLGCYLQCGFIGHSGGALWIISLKFNLVRWCDPFFWSMESLVTI
jgi:hypothetical protein